MDIANYLKNVLKETSKFLNQSYTKERIKNVASSITFVFGLVELYDLSQILLGKRQITTETDSNDPQWLQTANKVATVCGKISLVLSAGTSRPGVVIISHLAGRVCSTEKLEKIFGPNVNFAGNPWHPRHVVSFAAVIFAIPSVAQTTYRAMRYVNHIESTQWLTDAKLRLMVLFNTATSRPTLHLGNQFVRYLVRKPCYP